jgi:excisionase family DNA binding protein
MNKLMDTSQVAELLSVKPSTVRKWVHYGFIPYVKLGSCVRFVERDIETWVKQRAHEGRTSLSPETEWR